MISEIKQLARNIRTIQAISKRQCLNMLSNGAQSGTGLDDDNIYAEAVRRELIALDYVLKNGKRKGRQVMDEARKLKSELYEAVKGDTSDFGFLSIGPIVLKSKTWRDRNGFFREEDFNIEMKSKEEENTKIEAVIDRYKDDPKAADLLRSQIRKNSIAIDRLITSRDELIEANKRKDRRKKQLLASKDRGALRNLLREDRLRERLKFEHKLAMAAIKEQNRALWKFQKKEKQEERKEQIELAKKEKAKDDLKKWRKIFKKEDDRRWEAKDEKELRSSLLSYMKAQDGMTKSFMDSQGKNASIKTLQKKINNINDLYVLNPMPPKVQQSKIQHSKTQTPVNTTTPATVSKRKIIKRKAGAAVSSSVVKSPKKQKTVEIVAPYAGVVTRSRAASLTGPKRPASALRRPRRRRR